MATSKLPAKLRVGQLFYDVRAVDGSEMESPNMLGLTDNHKLVIKVKRSPETSTQHEARVLLHEALHAVFAESVPDVDWPEDRGEAEEFVISTIDSVLLGLIRDNPKFVEFLISKET